MTEKIRVKCSFCAYVWKPRVEKPVECPRCKNRLDRRKKRRTDRWLYWAAIKSAEAKEKGLLKEVEGYG